MADHEWVGILYYSELFHKGSIWWNVPYFVDGSDCKWISCNFVDSMYTGENYYGINFRISVEEAVSGR